MTSAVLQCFPCKASEILEEKVQQRQPSLSLPVGALYNLSRLESALHAPAQAVLPKTEKINHSARENCTGSRHCISTLMGGLVPVPLLVSTFGSLKAPQELEEAANTSNSAYSEFKLRHCIYSQIVLVWMYKRPLNAWGSRGVEWALPHHSCWWMVMHDRRSIKH